MSIIFTETEIKSLQKNPDALDALINQHECWIVEADSIGGYEEHVKNNERRIEELKAERDKIIAEY